jgi:hypothetical protein
MYFHDANAHPHASFTEMTSFTPFSGNSQKLSVATTSTTEGADLLVSSLSVEGKARLLRFQLVRASETASSLTTNLVGEIALEGQGAVNLGGD